MNLYRTTNPTLIKDVLTHPMIYPFVKDDGSPSAQDYTPIVHPDVHYLIAHKNVEQGAGSITCGLISFFPVTSGVLDVHIGMMPHGRGISAIRFAALALQYAFNGEKPLALKIIANIPAFNKRTIRFASCMGLKTEGISRKSFLYGGKMHDRVLMGITIDEYMEMASKSKKKELVSECHN